MEANIVREGVEDWSSGRCYGVECRDEDHGTRVGATGGILMREMVHIYGIPGLLLREIKDAAGSRHEPVNSGLRG